MKREEAIKVAGEMHGWLKTDREKEALETLIPELREGDSDRIRKEIISALKWANHRGVYDEHIAYMENLKPSFRKIHDSVMWDRGLRAGIELGKRKDVKVKYVYPKFRIGDVISCNKPEPGFINDYTIVGFNNEMPDYLVDGGNVPSCSIGIEFIDSNYHLKEQKPLERSDEDERIRKAILAEYKERLELETLAYKNPECNKDTVSFLEKAVAYLERQKEQRLLSISVASEWLGKNVCRYMNSEYNEFHKCVEYDGSIDKERLINDFEEAMQKESLRDFIDDFPYGDEQKEQKTINESNMHEPTLDEARKWNEAYEKGYSLGYENGRNERKSWEWSDEERKILDSIIDDYEKASKSFCGYDGKIGLLRAIRDGEYNLPKPAWSEEDEKLFWGFTAWVPNEELERLGVTRDDILKKLKSLRTQPKPAWSEEDEKIAKEIEEELWYPGDFPDYPSKEESELYDDCQRRLDWFKNKIKSLRTQPKAEWSEEDKKMLEEIINHIYTTSVQRIPARPGSDIGKSWIKFLKSLCPSWKPSEERPN